MGRRCRPLLPGCLPARSYSAVSHWLGRAGQPLLTADRPLRRPGLVGLALTTLHSLLFLLSLQMLDSVTLSQAVLCVGAQDGRSSPACPRNSEEAVEQAESTWKTSWRRWHKQSPSSEAEGLRENPGWVRVQGWGLRLHPLLVLQLSGAHKRASAS